jgi:hypothetical protein
MQKGQGPPSTAQQQCSSRTFAGSSESRNGGIEFASRAQQHTSAVNAPIETELAAMGNVFCSGDTEATKKGAFLDARGGVDDAPSMDTNHQPKGGGGGGGSNQLDASNSVSQLASGGGGLLNSSSIQSINNATTEQVLAAEQRLAYEQARCTMIVQKTGRAMVSVRSTRGSTVYYDQGFAAALSQHLEQTTQFANHVPARLPPSPTRTEATTTGAAGTSTSGPTSPTENIVYSILSRPEWDGIYLSAASASTTMTTDTPNHNAADNGKEVVVANEPNPTKYLDQVCEHFLDSIIPKKERLFVSAPPILETLLS